MLVVVSVVGLIGVDRRHDRWDRTVDRTEHRMGANGPGDWNGPGEFGRRSNDDGRRAGGGRESWPVPPGGPGRGPETRGPGRGEGAPDGDRDGADEGPDGSTTTSTTTTTAPGAGI